MAPNEARVQPLIVDPDWDFLKSIKADPQAKDLPPLLASTAAEALKLIAKPGAAFSAIFINPDLQAPYSIKIIQAAAKHHPLTPIFFMAGTNRKALTDAELEALEIKEVIQKPATYTDLLRRARILPSLFNPDEAIRIADLDQTKPNEIQQIADGNFFAVSAPKFVSGSTLLFNVYQRVDAGQYKKILQAGEPYDADRFRGKSAQEATLYLPIAVHGHYIKYSNWLCAALLGKSGVPFGVKVAFVLSAGEQVLLALTNGKGSTESLQNAEFYVERLKELVQDLGVNDVEALKESLLGCSAHPPEVLASLISAILVKQIDYRSMRSYQVVGIASLLRNISDESLQRISTLLDPSVLQTLNSKDSDSVRAKFKGTVFEIVESSSKLASAVKKAKSMPELNFHISNDLMPGQKSASPVTEAFRTTFLKVATLAT